MGTSTTGILSWVLIIAVFYFFLIMPEKKKQKNMKSMLNSVKAGDKIITRGGIYGTVFSLSEDNVVIVTGPDSVKLEMSKLSISSVVETKKESENVEEISEKTETADEAAESTEAKENSEDKAE